MRLMLFVCVLIVCEAFGHPVALPGPDKGGWLVLAFLIYEGVQDWRDGNREKKAQA